MQEVYSRFQLPVPHDRGTNTLALTNDLCCTQLIPNLDHIPPLIRVAMCRRDVALQRLYHWLSKGVFGISIRRWRDSKEAAIVEVS